MKKVNFLFTYYCGDRIPVHKRFDLLIHTMTNTADVQHETLVLIGFVLAVLTDTFGITDPDVTAQGAHIIIKIACGDHIKTVYNDGEFIPCRGLDHLDWLSNVREALKNPLYDFLLNDSLKKAAGVRP